jgi:hypothetical protein
MAAALVTAAVTVEANCTLNHTGTGLGGNNTVAYGRRSDCFSILSVSTCNFSGTYIGGASGQSAFSVSNACIYIEAAATVSVNGILTGGLFTLNYPLHVQSALANVSISGNVSASIAPAVFKVIDASSSVGSSVFFGGGIITNVNGVSAFYVPALKISDSNSTQWLFQTNDALVDRSIYTADLLTGYPLEAKVEDGTVYGPSSEFEGTLVPVVIDTAQLATDLLTEMNTSNLTIAQGLRDGMGASAAAIAAVGSINVIP